jgi:hypothetical protein
MGCLRIVGLRDPRAICVLRLIADLMLFSGRRMVRVKDVGRLLLFFRNLAGDCVNIDAIDTDVVQLVIGIAGKLLEYGPVGPASSEEARERKHFHEGLHCVILNRE